jgi:hypothetical protein
MNASSPVSPRIERGGVAVIAVLAALKLLLHLIFNGRYGYFRDELYYIVCGENLDWGYVDQAPLIAVVARGSRAWLGDSLLALRFFPALAGAGIVVLTALMVRELGGRERALLLACLGVVAAPVYLSYGYLLTMNSFEPLFWMGAVYVLIRIIKGGDARLWLVMGAIIGLGLENKHSMAFFGVALAAGVLLTPERKLLRSPWPWLGVLVALLLASPNLIWQAQHGWPTWELLNNVKNSSKNIVVGPVEYFGQQILLMNPLEFPLWFGGLLWLLLAGKARPFRALAWTYVAAFVIFVALKGKHYYLAPSYPMLVAAGSVFLEDLVERFRQPWLVAVYAGLIAAGGALLAPLVLPILPAEHIPAYMQAIHVEPPRTERSHTAALPQTFADQFGWQEMADSVAAVYQSLPPEEQRRARIFGQNYGEAGAIDVLGRKHGLPPAISGHQNYFFWGPRGAAREVIIVLDDEPGMLPEICGSVEDKGRIQSHPLAMPYEQRLNIYVCRNLKVSPEEVWPKVKKWL